MSHGNPRRFGLRAESGKLRHRHLGYEALEPRLALTWAGVPPVAIAPPAALSVTLNSQNDATGAASIATTEVDYYTFVARASGTYAISASTPTSSVDTVLGVFNSSGQRLAYNDDIVLGTNTDSRLLINLVAGQRYYVGITNYYTNSRGAYTWAIDGPGTTTPPVTPGVDLAGSGLTVTNSTTWGQTITAQSTVRNNGTTSAGSFGVQWYLSRDTVGSADDILLSRTGGAGSTVTLAGLAAGASSTFTVTLQLPGALPSGWSGTTFYVLMRTDSASRVAETNEANNFGQLGNGIDRSQISVSTITAPPPSGGFQITLNMTGMTVSQQSIFQQAADRWEQVIVGDLPNAVYRGITVDDLLIDASSVAIDGVNGILGQAGPDALRSGSRLPYHGRMQFDSADMARMESSGILLSVVMHEMGHVLGIGTIWSSLGRVVGLGTSNPTFTGAQATAAYNQIFGTSASGVPVENTGGPGTAGGHWRETIFSTELMTGWVGPGSRLPMSRVTVASLADIGYQVNIAAADAFTPSASARALAAQSSGGSASLRGLLAIGPSFNAATASAGDASLGSAPTRFLQQAAIATESVRARLVDAVMASVDFSYERRSDEALALASEGGADELETAWTGRLHSDECAMMMLA